MTARRRSRSLLAARRDPMLLIAMIVVWAIVLGISPGLALIAGALVALALDGYDSATLDGITGGR